MKKKTNKYMLFSGITGFTVISEREHERLINLMYNTNND